MVSKYSRSPHIRASPNYCILQSAYQQGHSTEMAISKILDDIIGSIDSGHVVALVSLDICAAFDSVTHDVLVQRLEDDWCDRHLRTVDQCLPHLYLAPPQRRGWPRRNFVKMFDAGKTRMIGLPYGEKNYDDMLSRFHLIP